MLEEVKNAQGGIILFIDEIHNLVGAGKTEGSMDAANLLKPMLARGELRCIGATTFDEYRGDLSKRAKGSNGRIPAGHGAGADGGRHHLHPARAERPL